MPGSRAPKQTSTRGAPERSSNQAIADTFDEIADLLAIGDENPFRVRAYENAARTIRGMGREVQELASEGVDLTRLPNVGKDLAGQIEEILATGKSSKLEAVKKRIPGSLSDLLKIPGLGPVKVRKLYRALRIKTRAQLKQAARGHKIAALPGFGEKTEQRLLEVLEEHRQKKGRFLRPDAAREAEPFIDYLRAKPGVRDVLMAGSYRRCRESVGDLDILVIAESGGRTSEDITKYPRVSEVISQGTTRATVILKSGIQVDVRVISPHCAGSALHYFTGSKAHNIQLRRLGQQRGLKINEYGVFRKEKRIAGKTESSVFKAVGLPYIEPELREGRGEIAEAKKGKLPELVSRDDIMGDLRIRYDRQSHSIEDWVRAASQLDLGYIALAFPWPERKPRGLTRKLDEFLDELAEIEAKRKRFGLLSALQVSIPENGILDLPAILADQVDLIIGSVDSHRNLSAKKQTTRIAKAMDTPGFTMLAHPLGRVIPDRAGIKLDIDRVMKHARRCGCFLELDARPDRLDLPDEYCRMAHDQGVLISINSAAATPDELAHLDFGVDQARRGWLERRDVLNTRTLRELWRLLGDR